MNRKGEAIDREGHPVSYQQSGNYHHAHDFDGSATMTATVSHAVADDIGMDVRDAERLIDGAVDTDALDRVFQPRKDGTQRNGSQITFSIRSHQVTVYGNGQLVIVPPR